VSEPFDPYHRWLGISPKDQPANHYRLLGIDPFESDPNVIEAAADRQMAHLRTYQTGRHGDVSQRLLNEVAAAKVALLNPAKKAAYDQRLRTELAGRFPPARSGAPLPVAESIPDGGTPVAREAPLPGITPSVAPAKRDDKGWSWALPAAIAAGLVVVAVLVVLILSAGNGEKPQLAREETEAPPLGESPLAPKPPDRPAPPPSFEDGQTVSDPTPPGEDTESVAEPSGEGALPATDGAETPGAAAVSPAPESEPEPESEPGPEPEQPPHSPDDDRSLADLLAPEQEPPGPTAAKSPVPDQAAQDQALALIREIYKQDYETAAKPPEKIALAKKMLTQAAKPGTSPTGRFVLLRVARDIAAEAGDADTAFEAIDRMAAGYDVDTFMMRGAALNAAGDSALFPEHLRSVAERAVKLIEEAAGRDEYLIANRLGDIAAGAARKLRDGELVRQIAALNRQVGQVRKAHAAIEPQLAKLTEDPDNADANLAVGRFYCLVKGDWERGIPMLALGSDPALAAPAQKELTGVASAEQQVQLADAWWDLAQNMDGPEKDAMLLHAASWYERAAPSLPTGLEKAKVEKRLEETAALERPSFVADAAGPRSVLRQGQWYDVLPWVDPGRDKVEGSWFRRGDTVVGQWGDSRLMLPVRLKGGYDLRIQFASWRNESGAVIGLPVGETSCQLAIGTVRVKGGCVGLRLVDGRLAFDNVTTVRPFKLAHGRKYVADIQVRVEGDRAAIAVAVDGKPLINWAGKQSSLTPLAEWTLPEADRPAIGVHKMIGAFSRVLLRPVSGSATRAHAESSDGPAGQ